MPRRATIGLARQALPSIAVDQLVTRREELVTRTELAQRLGITPERVRQLSLHRRFPSPAGTIGRARAWRRDEIATWAQQTGRRF
jgi:predicted DNA-binding transcriptional regulator AlpA